MIYVRGGKCNADPDPELAEEVGKMMDEMNTVKMRGRLLLFDKPTSNKTLFPKDCEITYAEKVPVVWEFQFNEPSSVLGFGSVARDDKGLICEVELNRDDRIIDILHEFDGELPIGGYYNGVKSHGVKSYQGDHLRVFDSGYLRCIGVTLFPVDEEYRMRIVEEEEKIKDENDIRRC